MSKSRQTALFSPAKLREAQIRLEEAQFPLSDAALDLQNLELPEPFQAYTVAASEALVPNPTQIQLIKSTRRVLAVIDRVTAWIDENLPKHSKVECKSGCSWCCSIPVTVLKSEAESINEHIQKTWNQESISALMQRTKEYNERASKLPEKIKMVVPQLCPFNVDNLCQIYDLRPISCRLHHSLSAKQCENAFLNWSSDPQIKRNTMRSVCSQAIIDALYDVLDFYHASTDTVSLPLAIASNQDQKV